MGRRGYLVIGGMQGWGRLVAFAAASEGGEVVVCDGAGGETGPATLPGEVARCLWQVPADVSREGEAERLLEATLRRLPALHAVVVVTRAAPTRSLAELTLSDWNATVVGPLREAGLACRAAVEEFLAGGEGGRIVLVSPPMVECLRGQAPAACLGAALEALARSVAKEYGGRGIACNVVTPCLVPGATPDGGIVDSVLFLASPEASYVSGECLRVGFSDAGSEALGT